MRVRYKDKYLYYATSPGNKYLDEILNYLIKNKYETETRSMPSGAMVIRILVNDVDKIKVKFQTTEEDVEFFKGDPFPWLKSEWVKVQGRRRKRD